MTGENNNPQPDFEAENPSNGNEMTDTDLEQVSGGLSSLSSRQPLNKARGNLNQDKWAGNNFGDIKIISTDESPKE